MYTLQMWVGVPEDHVEERGAYLTSINAGYVRVYIQSAIVNLVLYTSFEMVI